MGVFAADSHPEREPAGGELSERGELPGKRLAVTADNAEDILPVVDRFLNAGR